MNWFSNLKGRVKTEVLLSRYTTFKIGGKADFLIEPFDLEDLKKILKKSKENKLKVFIMGQGSNLLVRDEGINGVVVRLNSDYFKKIKILDDCIWASSGLNLSKILQFCIKNGLSGLEFLAGIPGTLGGALAMNAGTKEASIGERVKEVKVMDYNGNVKRLNCDDIKFGYRDSSLKRFIILEALLKLERKSKKDILNKIKHFQKYRRLTQELLYPSAGCIFKNPSGFSAGELIDACGLKGKSIGGAEVSLKHANFIINRNHASAKDVLELIDYIQDKVKKKFNIDLELEIEVW
jgi:UDP-N-acetylmuramate dehydrogenase